MASRWATTFTAVFLLATPQLAVAQSAAPVVSNEPPARFVLTQGGLVVGTKVGEDAEYYLVQTQAGVVRIRKTDVARIDLNFGVQPSAQPQPQPPAPSTSSPSPPQASRGAQDEIARRPGRALFLSGLIPSLSLYVIQAIGAVVVSIFDVAGNWLYVPVMGPVLYHTHHDYKDPHNRRVSATLAWTGFGFLAAAALVMVGGFVWWSADGFAQAGPVRYAGDRLIVEF